jgi:hypothetical protein
MGASDVRNGIWKLVHALSSTLAPNGAVTLVTGDVLSGNAEAVDTPKFQTPGFVSRPATPDSGKSAAEYVVLTTSDSDIAIAGRDVRGTKISGNLKDGEACAYAPGSQAKILFKANGGLALMTTADNTETGTTVSLVLDPDGMVMDAPWGRLRFDATGFHATTHAGAEIHAGQGGMPAPLDQFSTYVSFSADMAQTEASAISHGAAAGESEPAAKATSLVAYLTGLEAALVTAVGATGGSTSAGAASALATAIAGLQSAKAAAISTSSAVT